MENIKDLQFQLDFEMERYNQICKGNPKFPNRVKNVKMTIEKIKSLQERINIYKEGM